MEFFIFFFEFFIKPFGHPSQLSFNLPWRGIASVFLTTAEGGFTLCYFIFTVILPYYLDFLSYKVRIIALSIFAVVSLILARYFAEPLYQDWRQARNWIPPVVWDSWQKTKLA